MVEGSTSITGKALEVCDTCCTCSKSFGRSRKRLWRAWDAGCANWYEVLGRDNFLLVEERLGRGLGNEDKAEGAAAEDSPSVGVDTTGLIAAVVVETSSATAPGCLDRLRRASRNGNAGKANEGE